MPVNKREEEKELHWILDIFSYPVRGSGKYILITLTILSAISDLLRFAPLLGFVAGLILFAYFCAIYMNLVNSSACGDAEAPTFPDISNIFEDVILPMLQMLAVLLMSFLPLAAYLLFGARFGELNNEVSIGLVVFGVIYFPMALLAVTVLGTMHALSPHIVLPSIFRAMPHYLIAIFLLLGMIAIQIGLGVYLTGFTEMPWLARYSLLSAIGAYVLMANARTLGLVFRQREAELDWA